jgi:methyl-accepting chemotaxis protein
VTLAYLVVRRLVVRPLATLATGLERIAAGDTSARIAVATGDEIGALAATANTMAEALDNKATLAVASATATSATRSASPPSATPSASRSSPW